MDVNALFSFSVEVGAGMFVFFAAVAVAYQSLVIVFRPRVKTPVPYRMYDSLYTDRTWFHHSGR
jgi:hypothetical protein